MITCTYCLNHFGEIFKKTIKIYLMGQDLEVLRHVFPSRSLQLFTRRCKINFKSDF